jgi:hypothetical protein
MQYLPVVIRPIYLHQTSCERKLFPVIPIPITKLINNGLPRKYNGAKEPLLSINEVYPRMLNAFWV